MWKCTKRSGSISSKANGGSIWIDDLSLESGIVRDYVNFQIQGMRERSKGKVIDKVRVINSSA